MIQVHPQESLVGRAADAFERYRAGDRAAFDELISIMTPLMWRTVRGAGVDPVTSEDTLQTVWMNLLRSAESIRESQTIVKWLLTATRREAWRAAKRAQLDLSRSKVVVGLDDEESLALPDRGPALDDQVFEDDRQRALWSHVRSLSERCQQLLGVIAFADRPDYSHLAEALGMPVGSIGPTRGRCLAKLRDHLARDPHWEGQLS